MNTINTMTTYRSNPRVGIFLGLMFCLLVHWIITQFSEFFCKEFIWSHAWYISRKSLISNHVWYISREMVICCHVLWSHRKTPSAYCLISSFVNNWNCAVIRVRKQLSIIGILGFAHNPSLIRVAINSVNAKYML